MYMFVCDKIEGDRSILPPLDCFLPSLDHSNYMHTQTRLSGLVPGWVVGVGGGMTRFSLRLL